MPSWNVLKTITILAILISILPMSFASFPYSADWLKYADMRLIYEIDVSDIPNNDPNVYVIVDIDPAIIQSFIDRWSDVCDEANKYGWFYPTFTYASTINKGQRMLKVVEYNNWQTFTVGSCGSVELPTRFVLLLPDGVLDGGIDYQYVTHYVYAYFKYPYVEDFYDNPVGLAPEEYELHGSAVVAYRKDWPRGHHIDDFGCSIKLPYQFTVDLSKPFLICYRSGVEDGYFTLHVRVPLSEHEFRLQGVAEKCANISWLLRSRGESGTVEIYYIVVRPHRTIWTNWSYLDYFWLIPPNVFDRAAYGK